MTPFPLLAQIIAIVDVYDALTAGYAEATGNQIVATTYYGTRHTTANKPIAGCADMEGLKIRVPDVQVVRFDRDGDRSLTLRHLRRRGRPLTEATSEVLAHMRRLWGFAVRLETWENDASVDRVVECAA